MNIFVQYSEILPTLPVSNDHPLSCSVTAEFHLKITHVRTDMKQLISLEIWSDSAIDYRASASPSTVIPFGAIQYQIETNLLHLKHLTIHVIALNFWPEAAERNGLELRRTKPIPGSPLEAFWPPVGSQDQVHVGALEIDPTIFTIIADDPTIRLRALCKRKGIALHIQL